MAEPSFPVAEGIAPVTGLSLGLVGLFVSGRLVANLRLNSRRLYWDDYAAIAGSVLFTGYVGICLGVDHYARAHAGAWDATASYLLKSIYAAETLAQPASLAAKASVLLLYGRIFNPSASLCRGIAVVALVASGFALPSIPLFAFYCAPNATTTVWSSELATTCTHASPWAALQQTADVLINGAILVLPLPNIWRLHLSLRRRLLLVFVLMHGVFALAASITGAVYRVELARTPPDDPASALWYRTAAFVAFAVELGMTLVSSSFHACWGLVHAVHARRRSRKGSYCPSCEKNSSSGENVRASERSERSEQSERSPRSQRSERSGRSAQSHLRHSPHPLEPSEPPPRRPSALRAQPALDAGPGPTEHSTDPSIYWHRAPYAIPSACAFESAPPHVARLPSFAPSSASSSLSGPPGPVSPLESEHDAEEAAPHLCVCSPVLTHRQALMADIEAAVAEAGTARLVVGAGLPSRGGDGGETAPDVEVLRAGGRRDGVVGVEGQGWFDVVPSPALGQEPGTVPGPGGGGTRREYVVERARVEREYVVHRIL